MGTLPRPLGSHVQLLTGLVQITAHPTCTKPGGGPDTVTIRVRVRVTITVMVRVRVRVRIRIRVRVSVTDRVMVRGLGQGWG